MDRDIRLGTRFYEVGRDGTITAHVILELPFRFSGNQTLEPQWAIGEAIARSKKALADSDSIAARKAIGKRLTQLQKRATYERRLKKLPVFYEYLVAGSTEKTAIKLAAIPRPGNYFLPETKVYIAVTPATAHLMGTWAPRPELYFVIETTVAGVYYTYQGLGYNFLGNTRYMPKTEDVFATLRGAREALGKIIDEQVPAEAIVHKINVYSDEELKAA